MNISRREGNETEYTVVVMSRSPAVVQAMGLWATVDRSFALRQRQIGPGPAAGWPERTSTGPAGYWLVQLARILRSVGRCFDRLRVWRRWNASPVTGSRSVVPRLHRQHSRGTACGRTGSGRVGPVRIGATKCVLRPGSPAQELLPRGRVDWVRWLADSAVDRRVEVGFQLP